ncbi:three-helix bundle dimerization domain-containing protein [Kribbella sp. NBC_00662]
MSMLSSPNDADKVSQVVSEARPEFEDVPIRDFAPSLVERDAKQRLWEP